MKRTMAVGMALFHAVGLTALAESPLADAVETRARQRYSALLEGDERGTQASLRERINAPQPDGMTALHWAVFHEDEALVSRLLELGADPRAENRYQVTPLAIACQVGNRPIVDRLLVAGADPNSMLPGGETALMTAARTGIPQIVSSLLERGAVVDARERRGQTALMWAAAEGNLEVVDVLLKAGADYRLALASGFTPLYFAVREGKEEVVRRLLQEGEDVNGTMSPQKSAKKGPGADTSPLVLAVENGHFELAIALIQLGANPNDQRSGMAPLHMMAAIRKPNRGDDNGAPPPIGSGNLTSLQFVRRLVELGADVNLRLERGKSVRGKLSFQGATPFFMAADTADLALMRLLVELGGDPLIPNDEGSTPLMAAAGLGTSAPEEEAGNEDESLEAVAFILERGGDLNTVDDNLETAMHGAAYKNFPRMVSFLAEKGAKIEVWNHKNRIGWTPLQIAEGFRPGNFRPNPKTVEAIQRVMLDNGLELPPPTPFEAKLQGDEYRKGK